MNKTNKKISLELRKKAKEIKKDILAISFAANTGHIGSALSIADLITVLYFHIMEVDPKKKYNPLRDRFILSKGHAAAALYAALYRKGFLSKKELFTFCQNGGIFGVHPDYNLRYGIELSTGSLGHGLAVGVGLAISLRKKNVSTTPHVFVLCSDAELNEGSIWESIMFAAHHNISNLTVIVDDNQQQAFGKTKDVLDIQPIEKKWSEFGWNTLSLDGHNLEQIISALQVAKSATTKPTVLVARTIFGSGVSFMEGQIDWHYLPINKSQYKLALQKLR